MRNRPILDFARVVATANISVNFVARKVSVLRASQITFGEVLNGNLRMCLY